MKNVFIAAALFLAPITTFAMTTQEINAITSFAPYVVCHYTWQKAPTFGDGKVMLDSGYVLSDCKGYGNFADYLRASWLETYRQFTGITATQWTAEIERVMAKYK